MNSEPVTYFDSSERAGKLPGTVHLYNVVDRLLGKVPQPRVLRAAPGVEPVEPASVLLPTAYGQVKVDVLEGPPGRDRSAGRRSG